MENREKIIQEQRTIEAMKKGYIGYEGKFAYIVKALGYPIISQGGGNFEQTFLVDFYDYEEKDKDELPTMEEDQYISEIGMSYEDILSGNNLTILLLYSNAEITVRHKSKIVYKEISGDIEGFVPYELWEKVIENTYERAKKIEKQKKPIENEKLQKKINKKKKEILDKLKEKWGI